MSLEVFVHKAEKLQEDDKIGMSRTIFNLLMLILFKRTFGRSMSEYLIACWMYHLITNRCN